VEAARPGPLQIGDSFLGKYEIRALLGKGGHAFVYEALDRFLDRLVAIKVIKSPKDAGRDLGPRAQKEAQLLSRADDPHLVKVIDAGIADGLVYLVMERLHGRTLRDALKELGRLSVAEALVVGLQVADGMEVAHRLQVIHRDLKPENIFIELKNAVKVLDFGIAKVLGIGVETTQKDLLQGTVLYMSPEHLQGFGVTPRSDVYALGTILFEALYSHPLTVGERPAGLQEAAWMQIAKVPPLLDELDPSIPHYVAKLVHRAIVKMPEQRYGSMRELREAISVALERLRGEAKTNPSRFILRDLSKAPPPEQPEPEPKPVPRDTLRAAPVLTNQVTVQAPFVQGGDTEPVSKLPFSAPQHSAPTPAPPRAMLSHPRDDRTPLIYGTVPAPPSSEKPTISATPASKPPPASPVGPSVALGTQAAPPRPLARHAPFSVPPSTAPPVSTRVAPRAQVRTPGPLLKDRAVRLAAISAIVVGVLGGTTYGVLSTRSATEPSMPTLEAAVATPLPAAETLAAAPPTQSPSELVAPKPDAPPSHSTRTSLSSASSPQPPPAQPLAVATQPPLAPKAAASKTKATNARTPADAELQQRLDWLDRDPQPKPATSPLKPATPATKPPPKAASRAIF